MDSKELRAKLDSVLTSVDVVNALETSFINGDFDALPEIADIVKMGDGQHMHKNVWEHTKHVVAGVPNLLELRWAALLHDIGKARTRRFTVDGNVTFQNHDVVGERMVANISARTKLFINDDALLSTVKTLVLQHLRPPSYGPSWTDSAVRRLVTDCGGQEIFSKLMNLSRADLTTRVHAKRARALSKAAALEERVQKIVEQDSALRLPKGTMGIILEQSGKKPGKWLREAQAELELKLRAGEFDHDATAQVIASSYKDKVGSL